MKRSLIVSILSFSLLAASASPVLAGTKDVPNSGFQIFTPDDGFKLDGNAQLLTAASTDQSCMFLWTVADGKDLEKAASALTQLMQSSISDIKEGKPTKKKVNGLPTLEVLAKGIDKETKKEVLMRSTITELEGKVLITVGAVHADQKAKYKAVGDKVFAGIKKK